MEMSQKQKNTNQNRFVITAVILGTFFLIMVGIGSAILGEGETPTFSQEWKEILLLVLGAFIGSYSKIIDYWFGSASDDNTPMVEEKKEEVELEHYCQSCGADVDPVDNF